MKKFMKFCLSLLIIAAIVAGAGYYFLFTTKNLDTAFTEADFNSYVSKTGVKVSGNTAGYVDILRSNYVATGSIPLEVTVTPEELNARIFKVADRDSLKDLKIKLNDDGTFEATFKVGDTFDSLLSMVADVSKYQKYIDLAKDKPIYIKSSVVYNGGNSFSIQTQELSVGRISVPLDRVNSEMTSVRAEINNVLSSMPGLTIENFSFDSTGVKFKGTIPESINIKNN